MSGGLFAVDAGGTRSRVLVRPAAGGEHQVELPSINPCAGPSAGTALPELVGTVRALLGAGPVAGWIASASVRTGGAGPELDGMRDALAALGPSATVVASNDIVPLPWGVPALDGEGVTVVCGTGSGWFGASADGRTAHVGGCEYLAGDEGGATYLGTEGLRAAVRAADGRGGSTALCAAITAETGREPAELAREVARAAYPKQRLAALAPVVCRTWLAGDAVAGDVVSAAIGELICGARAVRDRLGLPAGFAVATTGGVLARTAPFHAELARRLRAELGAGPVELVTDTAAVVLACLRRVLGPGHRPLLPPALAGHAWVLCG